MVKLLSKEVYKAAFNNEQGKMVLEELKGIFYDVQSFEDDAYRTAFNEGKRAVIALILHKIKE